MHGSTPPTPAIVGERHYACAARVRTTLAAYRDLRARVSMPGAARWNDKEQLLAHRARRLRAFLGQPLFVAAGATGKSGRLVHLEDTIAGCEAIVEGRVDGVAEEAFWMVGEVPAGEGGR